MEENSFGLKPEVLTKIRTFLASQPEIEEVYVFGSRARGDFRPASDVDLAVKFSNDCDSMRALLRLRVGLDDLPIIYRFDVVDLAKLKDDRFAASVRAEGELLYRKGG